MAKYKVLKNVVHKQKVHRPAGKGEKATVIELTKEEVHDEHIAKLVDDGTLEEIEEAKKGPPSGAGAS